MTLDPSSPPFWERERGGGPISRAIETPRRFERLREIRDELFVLAGERSVNPIGNTSAKRQRCRDKFDSRIAELRAEALRLDPSFRLEGPVAVGREELYGDPVDTYRLPGTRGRW